MPFLLSAGLLAACGIDSDAVSTLDPAGAGGNAAKAGAGGSEIGRAGTSSGGTASAGKGGSENTGGKGGSPSKGGAGGSGEGGSGDAGSGDGGSGDAGSSIGGSGTAGKGGNTGGKGGDTTGGAAGKGDGGTAGMGTAGTTSGSGGTTGGAGGGDAGSAGNGATAGSAGAGGSGTGGSAGSSAGTGGSSAGTGGTSAGTGGSNAGTGGSSAGAAGNGGDAGAAGGVITNKCGNGKIDPGEECDKDAGAIPGLVCAADCKIECAKPGIAFRDPTTKICYFALTSTGGNLAWAPSGQLCAQVDGRYATFEDDAVRTRVAAGLGSTNGFWVGAHQDTVTKGCDNTAKGWVWKTGKKDEPAVASSSWRSDEPNDSDDGDTINGCFEPREEGIEDCGEASGGAQLRMNDLKCSDLRAVLCQR